MIANLGGAMKVGMNAIGPPQGYTQHAAELPTHQPSCSAAVANGESLPRTVNTGPATNESQQLGKRLSSSSACPYRQGPANRKTIDAARFGVKF